MTVEPKSFGRPQSGDDRGGGFQIVRPPQPDVHGMDHARRTSYVGVAQAANLTDLFYYTRGTPTLGRRSLVEYKMSMAERWNFRHNMSQKRMACQGSISEGSRGTIPPGLFTPLRCPLCRGALASSDDGLSCPAGGGLPGDTRRARLSTIANYANSFSYQRRQFDKTQLDNASRNFSEPDFVRKTGPKLEDFRGSSCWT